MAKLPHLVSFNHTRVETVTLGQAARLVPPIAYRAVKRDGSYPAVGAYAAGITYIEAFGRGNHAFNGFLLEEGINYPDLRNALPYPATATALTVGQTFYSAAADYYIVATAATSSALATDEARIAADVLAGTIVQIPTMQNSNVMESSTTQYSPNTFVYQGYIPIVTDGHCIFELARQQAGFKSAIAKDDPLIVADAFGRLGARIAPLATDVIIGRALDNVTAPLALPTGASAFDRIANVEYSRVLIGSVR